MIDKEVKSKLEEDLSKKARIGTPIVWFDPNKQFVDYVDELELPGKVVKLDESALKLRYDLESEDPAFQENWIIYVPRKKKDADWLREYWLIGLTYEKGAAKILRNLGYTVTHEERKRLRDNSGNEIVNSPSKALERENANNPERTIKFGIESALDLDSFTFNKATLEFIKNTDESIECLEDKNLENDFIQLLSSHYGIEEEQDLPNFKEKLVDSLFFGELAYKSNLDLSAYSNLLPNEASQNECAQFIATWQSHNNYQDEFKEQEKEFRSRYSGVKDLVSKETEPSDIWDVKGIRVLDKTLVRKTDSLISEDDIGTASRIIEKRERTYWALKHTNTHASDWQYLGFAKDLLERLDSVEIENNLEELVNGYTDLNWEIDRVYRRTSELLDELDFVEESPSHLKFRYKNYLRDLNDKFSEEFDSGETNLDQQLGVLGSVSDGTVVFVLDALRYELAHDFEKVDSVKPLLGILPSKTNVGMASMLPEGEGLDLSSDEDGLDVRIEGKKINKKSDRIEHLQSHNWEVYKNLEALTAEDIDEVAEKAREGQKVLIYSQQLDLMGENLEEISLSLFNRIIGKAQNKADKLLKKGVEKIMITTDHGFLYKPKENESEPVPKPEGSLMGCGPRYSFGKNLNSGNNVSVDVSKYGVDTDLDFIFPPSLGIFSTPGRGRRFLHGGLSLQEIVIPLVEITGDSRAGDDLKVSISDAPDEVGSPQFQIELKGTQSTLKSNEKIVRIEVSQYGNRATKDHTYSSIANGTSKAIINLDTSAIENKSGTIELKVFDDETNVRLDSKEIDINLLYSGGGL